jgi:porin
MPAGAGTGLKGGVTAGGPLRVISPCAACGIAAAARHRCGPAWRRAGGWARCQPWSLALLQDRGNFGIYAIVDQMLWRVPGTIDQGLGIFAQASVSPSDRNLISANFDRGATYKGLFPGRVNDTLGIGFGVASISSRARALDRDAVSFSGIDSPIRDYEAVVEITYQAQITSNWMLQPVFQYIAHPGGHTPNPVNVSGSSAIPNAAVFGLRTMVKY